MSKPTLVHLSYSPWSERSRWALAHHQLAYRSMLHLPVFGELRLRRLLGRRHRPATVPVLIDEGTVLTDSWDIARYADRVGDGAPLLPADHIDEIRRWNGISEATMSAGRVFTVSGLLADPEALDETLPPAVPGWVRKLSRPINHMGVRWFARKHGIDLDDLAAAEAQVRRGLDSLREGLDGRETLLTNFSYADILMAISLQGVSPVDDRFLRMGPATRRVWTVPRIARDYEDLLAWRDAVFERHRPPVA